jgi:hypothetical protein
VLPAFSMDRADAGWKLEQDGRQPRASGIVIQSGAHQGHGLNNAETILQTPAQQRAVAGGDKGTRGMASNGSSNGSVHPDWTPICYLLTWPGTYIQ